MKNFPLDLQFSEVVRSHIAVFALACTCEISSVPVELQLEWNALQEDDVLVKNFRKKNLIDFYKSLPVAEYYNLKQFAKNFYVCLGVHILTSNCFRR